MNKIGIFLIWGILMSFLNIGCSSPSPKVYQNEKPILKLEEYLNGEFVAHGIFTDRWGIVKKRFVCEIVGQWDGTVLTLDESFTYSDGTKQKRIWSIRKTGEGTFVGTAGDVVGQAKGESSGNALYWEYTMALDVDGTVYNVQFEDWMYLMDDRVMLNKSVMKKFGIKLGEVTLSFYKK